MLYFKRLIVFLTGGQGLAYIDYEYHAKSPNDNNEVEVTAGMFGEPWVYDIPYEGNWSLQEYINLFAIDFFTTGFKAVENIDTFYYTFHHWEERDWTADTTITIFNSNPYQFFVFPSWGDSIHFYIAYFTGGPFYSYLVYPPPDTIVLNANEIVTLKWFAPEGARLTCSLYVDYSINGGSSWSNIAGPIKYNNNYSYGNLGSYDWLVPDLYSNNCNLRIIAFDIVDNWDTLISHQFTIDNDCCVGIRGNVDGDTLELIDIADLVYLVDYMFGNPNGPVPPCMDEANIDGLVGIDIDDLVYLVAYMYSNGPPPADCP